MDNVSDLPKLFLNKSARGVPRVLIAGVAVCLHGFTRASRDVDLFVRHNDRDRIREVFESAE